MLKNDVLRKIRYILDFSDKEMTDLFLSEDLSVSREQLCQWLKKDDDDDFKKMKDVDLAVFLNGLINEKRGKKEGARPVPENNLTNNMIFRKLAIAFNLKADEIIEVLIKIDFRISKPELSAFFRKSDHRNYRECKDQILRNFLLGLQLKFKNN